MSKISKKWLIGTGIVVAGAAAVGAGIRAISHYFVKIAMDRKCPGKVQENISMISGGSRNEELLELTEQATKELESAVCRPGWKRKAQRAGDDSVIPVYTMADTIGPISRFRPCEYGQVIQAEEGIVVRFPDIGHLLGSACMELWLTEDGNTIW